MPESTLKYILFVFISLLPCSVMAQTDGAEGATEEWFAVTRVVDGDTFWVADSSGNSIKIRLIGIDAPEPRNTGTRPKGFFGAESTNYLRQLLNDKKVRLEYDVSRYDRYKRTLAYAYLEDGTFVNAELVKNGYATVMTVPPNVKHQETFTRLAARARGQNRGLWKGTPSAK
ncbi:MAG TPA: thermonuclease family protein [Bacteroidales bacterium]|nr:thermonuclease family protein [Bacteroidales bacterium]HRW27850.1 thermonuclease family protein [Bacteroidales bacterium]